MATEHQPPADLPTLDGDDGTPQPLPVPGEGMRLQDAQTVIDLFQRAAQANLNSRWRKGATAHLPDAGWLVMTGDLHDNGLNFQRILKLADLHRHDDHHLIIHEVIHGPHRINDRDMSIRTLARVAALKLAFPERVHLLQSNHELAQRRGDGILKENVNVVAAFDRGVDFVYAEEADAVRAAMGEFIRSLLVAVKCPGGVFCSHSLPGPRHLEGFDTSVIDRVPTDDDLAGPVYQMVWGRDHTQPLADTLAQVWDTRLFVMGHQPAEMGYEREGDSMLILASDHSHGVALPINLGIKYTMDDLIGQIIPLGAVVL